MESTSELLILRAPKLRKRLERLVEQIEADSSLRQWFINDPTRVICAKVFPEGVPAAASEAEVSRGNRLLYAILSNSEFRSWAASYEQDLLQRARVATSIDDPRRALETYLATVNRASIQADLARAVARYADAELIAGLTWQPFTRYRDGWDNLVVEVSIAIYAVAAAAVFAIAVGAVFLGADGQPVDGAFTRVDLATVANEIAAALQQRAAELRQEGSLLDYDHRDSGFTG